MKHKKRRYFSVIDGIVAGEGQGPFCPTSKNANTLIVSDNLFAADCVAVRYMGFNPKKIKYLQYFLESEDELNLSDIIVQSNGKTDTTFFERDTRYLDFNVVNTWKDIKF